MQHRKTQASGEASWLNNGKYITVNIIPHAERAGELHWKGPTRYVPKTEVFRMLLVDTAQRLGAPPVFMFSKHIMTTAVEFKE